MRPTYIIVSMVLLVVVLAILIGMLTGAIPDLNKFIADLTQNKTYG